MSCIAQGDVEGMGSGCPSYTSFPDTARQVSFPWIATIVIQ